MIERTTAPEPIEPFDAAARRRERATARAMFADHHDHTRDPRNPDTCSACALETYNHAGWLPLWIADRRPIDAAHFVAELESARVGNPRYFRQCLRAIATFGLCVRTDGEPVAYL